MMDFRIDQNHGTQFIYILPYNSKNRMKNRQSLNDIINKKNSEVLLDKYINKNFGKYELIDKEVRDVIMSSENIINKKKKIIEIIMDLGRRPEARFPTGPEYLSQKIISWQDMDYIIKRINGFSNENRAGIEHTLHRISCIRNRQFLIVE